MPRPVCHPDVGSRHWGNLQRMQVGDIGAARFWKRNVAFLLMNETNLPCVRYQWCTHMSIMLLVYYSVVGCVALEFKFMDFEF